MRFLLVDKATVQYFTSSRMAQSTEFDLGEGLSHFLMDTSLRPNFGEYVSLFYSKEGVYFLSPSEKSKDSIIFDLGQAALFSELSNRQVLTVFQTVLRFATRYWSKHKQTTNVKFVQDSSKAVVFPFPRSQGQGYRIAIELEPDAERAKKRDYLGNNLLVYKSAHDEGAGADEQPSLTNYRKALLGLPAAREGQKGMAQDKSDRPAVESLAVTHLKALDSSRVPHQTYDEWISGLLTRSQRKFVEAPLSSPHRIEGPAGTGKTLSLVLKSIYVMRDARAHNSDCHILFVVHSEASGKSVHELFEANDVDGFFGRDRQMHRRTITIITLQKLAATFLPGEVFEVEFLDPDGYHAKEIQILHTSDSFSEAMEESYQTHMPFMSQEFCGFLEAQDSWLISELLQHEISVVIKGRASGELDKYKRAPRPIYGLPLETENDRGFVFSIYERYQEKLRVSGKFDTDDIVLSAIGQLNTPIWQRRRETEGYDAVMIDETHLFNLNELSILHYITRRRGEFPIAYSVDRSQAIGDKGWTDELFEEAVRSDSGIGSTTRVEAIFRSSPEIINLACSVTSSGATLFTNFDDPMRLIDEAFTLDEESKSEVPTAIGIANDEQLIIEAFSQADNMAKQMSVPRSEILVVPFSESLLHNFEKYVSERNKPAEMLKRRSDVESVNKAKKAGRYVLGAPDFVGGLEFSGVVLVGVDKGRVPPSPTLNEDVSQHYLSYAAHNRLYVAITRAKYRVAVLFSSQRGLSPIFDNALKHKWLVKEG